MRTKHWPHPLDTGPGIAPEIEPFGPPIPDEPFKLRPQRADFPIGKIGTSDAALDNFFRIENLAALREVSLRQVAEDVESKRLIFSQGEPLGTRGEERVSADAPRAVGERLLALIRPQPSSQRLVRRAWRSAQRLGTELDLLWVKPPGKPIEGEQDRQVTALRQLASVLGATFLIEEHDDLVAAVARVVRERGSTYIMVGEADPPHGLARLREPLPQRLMRATPPGVDVRIVAHRGLKEVEK